MKSGLFVDGEENDESESSIYQFGATVESDLDDNEDDNQRDEANVKTAIGKSRKTNTKPAFDQQDDDADDDAHNDDNDDDDFGSDKLNSSHKSTKRSHKKPSTRTSFEEIKTPFSSSELTINSQSLSSLYSISNSMYTPTLENNPAMLELYHHQNPQKINKFAQSLQHFENTHQNPLSPGLLKQKTLSHGAIQIAQQYTRPILNEMVQQYEYFLQGEDLLGTKPYFRAMFDTFWGISAAIKRNEKGGLRTPVSTL